MLNCIRTSNNISTLGFDEILVSLLKYCSRELVLSLTHVINTWFTTGVHSSELKHTIVRPVHKKGEFSKLENYRSIALISNVFKLIEKLMEDRVNNIQNGHIKGSSIIHTIYQLLQNIPLGLNNWDSTVCTLLELLKR